jgi:RNA polymerase sigma-70 factor (ECF subfamily)
MAKSEPQDVTQLLLAWSHGDQAALEKLTVLVEAELRRLAQGYLSRERQGHTLQPTALVNEVYLRLIDWKNTSWQNKAHFVGVIAQLMRRVLVDHARRHRNLKRGGEVIKVPIEEGVTATSSPSADLVDLDEALQRLAPRYQTRQHHAHAARASQSAGLRPGENYARSRGCCE